MSGLSRNFFVLLFCLAGSSLTVVNKILISEQFRHPSLLTLCQCCFAAVLIHLGRILIPSVKEAVQPIAFETSKKWSILVFLFVLMLLSSMFALETISVTTLTVVRNLTTLTTAMCDYFFLNTKFTVRKIFCLFTMLAGAVMYGSHDMSFHAVGYLYLLVNCIATTTYQIKVKVLVNELGLSALSMSYYNNVLCLPALCGVALFRGEVSSAAKSENVTYSNYCVMLVLISSVLGFMLSVTAFRLNQLVSATSIMIINNANKFLLIVYSEIFLTKSIGNISAVGCAMVLLSSFIYSFPPRDDWNGKSTYSPVPILSNAHCFLLSCAVLTVCYFISPEIQVLLFKLFKDRGLKDTKAGKLSWDNSPVICDNDSCTNNSEDLSFHKCIGHGFSSRSCIFCSVTYNVAQQRYEYFNPLKNFVVNIENHRTMHEFPAKFVTLKPMIHRGTSFWTIKRLHEKLPDIPAQCTVNSRVLFWQSMAVLSVGHTLADDLFGSFRVLESLGLNPMEYTRVILHEQSCKTQTCARMSKLWYPSVSGEPVQYWQEFLMEMSKCPRILFKRLIVGGGGSAIMQGNLRYENKYNFKTDQKPIGNRLLSETWLKFRNQVFVKLNLDSALSLSKDERHQITIFNKTRSDQQGRKVLTYRSIQNIDEISEALSKSFPEALVKVVDPSTFESFYEEVREMGRSTILISPPGSIQFSAIFLPPHAFLIGIDACLGNAKKCTTGNEEVEHIFSHIGYLNTLRYTRKGEKIMYLDSDRVKSLVKQALQSHSRHERYKTRERHSSSPLIKNLI